MKRFYVYTLTNPKTNNVFYVGKGTGNRAFKHEINCIRHPEKYSKSKKDIEIQSIIKSGLSVYVSIVKSGMSEVDALDLEAELISSIGLDNLTNTLSKGALSCSDICNKISSIKALGTAMLSLPEIWLSESIGSIQGYSLKMIYQEIEDAKSSIDMSDNSLVVRGFSSAIESFNGRKFSNIPIESCVYD